MRVGDADNTLKEALRFIELESSEAHIAERARAALTVREPGETSEWKGVYPGMCVDPETCRGRSACPRDYSCCE